MVNYKVIQIVLISCVVIISFKGVLDTMFTNGYIYPLFTLIFLGSLFYLMIIFGALSNPKLSKENNNA